MTPSEELMLRYQNHADPKAFQELYSRYSGRVYGYLSSRITRAEERDEIHQAVFLKFQG